ncbi:MAG: hypothetical protein Q9162_006336 [Coniocarpon cinnabarinum]
MSSRPDSSEVSDKWHEKLGIIHASLKGQKQVPSNSDVKVLRKINRTTTLDSEYDSDRSSIRSARSNTSNSSTDDLYKLCTFDMSSHPQATRAHNKDLERLMEETKRKVAPLFGGSIEAQKEGVTKLECQVPKEKYKRHKGDMKTVESIAENSQFRRKRNLLSGPETFIYKP